MSAILIGKGKTKQKLTYDPRVLAQMVKMYQAENLQKKPLFGGHPQGMTGSGGMNASQASQWTVDEARMHQIIM